MSNGWREANGSHGLGLRFDLRQRLQQQAAALALKASGYRAAPSLPHAATAPRKLTMNQTIERLTHRLADLKGQHANLAANTAAAIAQAEAAERNSYQALLDAIADGRDATQQSRAHETAQAALHDAQLLADVGQVRAQRLQAEIQETAELLAQEQDGRRRRLIEALERARDELEHDLVELTERRFEAEARGLQINARLHQLQGFPGTFATVPEPYGYPLLRPITMSNPAPPPVFPALHRQDTLERIAAEVAQIGSEL